MNPTKTNSLSIAVIASLAVIAGAFAPYALTDDVLTFYGFVIGGGVAMWLALMVRQSDGYWQLLLGSTGASLGVFSVFAGFIAADLANAPAMLPGLAFGVGGLVAGASLYAALVHGWPVIRDREAGAKRASVQA